MGIADYAGISIAVVALCAIAAPNFLKTRCVSRSRHCIANLKQLDSAKEQYAMDHELDDDASVPAGILWAPEQYIKSEPKCPEGGRYTLGAIGVDPVCSLGDERFRGLEKHQAEHTL